MPRTIPLEEITFHQTIDPNGNLFWWQGQPYRAVRRHHRDFVLHLFRSGIVDGLVSRGLLVPTEVTGWSLKGYALVLQHRRVPFISLFSEWNAPMFRDAALAQLELETTLEAQGLMLQDGHTENTLFDGPRPVFVDFCSMVPNLAARVWEAEDEFRRNFVNPLRLLSAGRADLLRSTMRHDRLGVPHAIANPAHLPPAPPARTAQMAHSAKRKARALLPNPAFAWLKRQQRYVQRKVADRDPSAQSIRARRLAGLHDEIAALAFPAASPAALDSRAEPPGHPAVLAALLERLQPATVLDLSDSGHGAAYAAQHGIAAAWFAPSETAQEQAYQQARLARHCLLPVCLPPDGQANAPGWLTCQPDLDERYRADLVTALHLHPPASATGQAQLLDGIRAFSRRWVLLSDEWLDEILRAGFDRLERVDDLVLCEAGSLTGLSLPHSVD